MDNIQSCRLVIWGHDNKKKNVSEYIKKNLNNSFVVVKLLTKYIQRNKSSIKGSLELYNE